MSLERRIVQMRQEAGEVNSLYLPVEKALKKDAQAMFDFFQKKLLEKSGGVAVAPIDQELVDVYELKPEEIPTLSLPNNLSFVEAFSYVAAHWYPYIRIIGTNLVKPDDEQFMDIRLKELFPKENVTILTVRDSLATDPSGATWLEERAKVEFTGEGTLSRVGAQKAINGARKMYERLTVAA